MSKIHKRKQIYTNSNKIFKESSLKTQNTDVTDASDWNRNFYSQTEEKVRDLKKCVSQKSTALTISQQ